MTFLSEPVASHARRGSSSDQLRPSEYTAALVHVLRNRARFLQLNQVAEIGVGSGVVLAVLAELGAARLYGVDIETEAVESAAALLSDLGFEDRANIVQGDLWEPLEDRRFDLIVANLPHFPTMAAGYSDRFPGWSHGGRDGRRLLDPFLEGLPRHLASGGRALITHNAFVDIERSRRMLRPHGLELRTAYKTTVYLPREKSVSITPEVLARCEGHTIHYHGAYAFGEMHIVEIGRPDQLLDREGGCGDTG